MCASPAAGCRFQFAIVLSLWSAFHGRRRRAVATARQQQYDPHPGHAAGVGGSGKLCIYLSTACKIYLTQTKHCFVSLCVCLCTAQQPPVAAHTHAQTDTCTAHTHTALRTGNRCSLVGSFTGCKSLAIGTDSMQLRFD